MGDSFGISTSSPFRIGTRSSTFSKATRGPRKNGRLPRSPTAINFLKEGHLPDAQRATSSEGGQNGLNRPRRESRRGGESARPRTERSVPSSRTSLPRETDLSMERCLAQLCIGVVWKKASAERRHLRDHENRVPTSALLRSPTYRLAAERKLVERGNGLPKKKASATARWDRRQARRRRRGRFS